MLARDKEAGEVDVDLTQVAPVSAPCAGSTTNQAPAVGAGGQHLEGERVLRVHGVVHLLGQPGAARVDIELARLAPVEESLYLSAADIADAHDLPFSSGLADHEAEPVHGVQEGGQGLGAGGAVLV